MRVVIIEAAKRYNIDLTASYMIGDTTADIAAGAADGCKTAGVLTGEGLSDVKYSVKPDYLSAMLYDAVVDILNGGMSRAWR